VSRYAAVVAVPLWVRVTKFAKTGWPKGNGPGPGSSSSLLHILTVPATLSPSLPQQQCIRKKPPRQQLLKLAKHQPPKNSTRSNTEQTALLFYTSVPLYTRRNLLYPPPPFCDPSHRPPSRTTTHTYRPNLTLRRTSST
jgi:hypothetical protein